MTTALYHDHLDSPVGRLTMVASDVGLRAVLWPDDRPGRVRLEPSEHRPEHRVLTETRTQLTHYFATRRPAFDVALDPQGTEFQRAVWTALSTVEHGRTTTYGAIAGAIGRPTAFRAVGSAIGRNPISIIVPCHRVVGRDGSLTGFAGGMTAKRWLLEHEGVLQPLER